jgi:hypothetical protein
VSRRSATPSKSSSVAPLLGIGLAGETLGLFASVRRRPQAVARNLNATLHHPQMWTTNGSAVDDGLRFFDVGPKVSPTTYRAAHRRSLLEVCRDVTAKGLGE